MDALDRYPWTMKIAKKASQYIATRTIVTTEPKLELTFSVKDLPEGMTTDDVLCSLTMLEKDLETNRSYVN